jgi:hypothetical protein
MHHGGNRETTCKMRGACGQSDAALLTLAGGLGILPSATIGVTVFDPDSILRPAVPSTELRADRPDSPPPRA